MITSTLLVTVRGSAKTIDLELPGDVPVGELIPLLLEICASQEDDPNKALQTPIVLQVAGAHVPLSEKKTLIEAGIYDGAVLELQTKHTSPAQEEDLALRPFVPKSVQPDAGTGGIGVTWKTQG